jgi:hypothetical protein
VLSLSHLQRLLRFLHRSRQVFDASRRRVHIRADPLNAHNLFARESDLLFHLSEIRGLLRKST